MAIKIVIPGELVDLNKYINAERTNKFLAAKIKKQETDVCYLATRKYKKLNPEKRYKANFAWFTKDKRKDPDNIAFAKKFVFDGCVKSGFLRKDGWSQIAGFSDTFQVSPNPRVEVEFEQV